MKISKLLFLILFPFSVSVVSANEWPKEIKTKSGVMITVYQPQPESMKGDKLKGRAAFSARPWGECFHQCQKQIAFNYN